MTVYKKLLVVMALLAPLALPSIALAQTDGTPESTSIEERLAERKERLQTRLTTAQQTRLRARCKAAQTKLVQFEGRVNSMERNRKAAHKVIIERLNNLVEKVGDQADTTDLRAAIVTLQSKADAVEASLISYKQAVSDLATMDCVADPAAFQATLSEVRTLRADLANASGKFRTFFRTSVKPLLETLKTSLQARDGAS